jgi:hypothetical protein
MPLDATGTWIGHTILHTPRAEWLLRLPVWNESDNVTGLGWKRRFVFEKLRKGVFGDPVVCANIHMWLSIKSNEFQSSSSYHKRCDALSSIAMRFIELNCQPCNGDWASTYSRRRGLRNSAGRYSYIDRTKSILCIVILRRISSRKEIL